MCIRDSNMIRQAAERLGADNVFIACFGELEHFCREKPAFAHFVAIPDNLSLIHILLAEQAAGEGAQRVGEKNAEDTGCIGVNGG